MSIIIGIDHGYYAINTAHCSFPYAVLMTETGLSLMDAQIVNMSACRPCTISGTVREKSEAAGITASVSCAAPDNAVPDAATPACNAASLYSEHFTSAISSIRRIAPFSP